MADQEWTECAVHTRETDTDCEFCERELDQKNKVKERLSKNVVDMNNKLTAMKMPFLQTQMVVHSLKIDVFLDMFVQDPKTRMAFEINYLNRLHLMMLEAEKMLIRAQLMPNGMMPGQQFIHVPK
jgi:glycyl-tRNA synthetase (class II)